MPTHILWNTNAIINASGQGRRPPRAGKAPGEVTALQFHGKARGENTRVLPKMIVGIGILVKILEHETCLELPANLRFQCMTELVACVKA